jgi:hypothetical protein
MELPIVTYNSIELSWWESDLVRDGLAILDDQFDEGDLRDLNEVASKLPAFVGSNQDKQWLNDTQVEQIQTEGGVIDWRYNWAKTPEDNPFINNTILPTLTNVANIVFDGKPWGWQTTNQYIMSNYKHDTPIAPHFDAPYMWPQARDVQLAKTLPQGPLSLTFMVPLCDFTQDNGATAYVPGTHKHIYDTTLWRDMKAHMKLFFEDNYIQPSIPIGSVACFFGNCLHSVMPNTTDTARRGIIYRAIRHDALDEMTRLELG